MARKPRDPAWKPTPEYDYSDIAAMRALREGKASPEQQMRALDWIIEKAAGFREEPFRSDADGGERETSYALGRQHVARQIVKLLTLPGEIVNELRKKDGRRPERN